MINCFVDNLNAQKANKCLQNLKKIYYLYDLIFAMVAFIHV